MRCQCQSQRCTGACWALWPRNTILTSSRRYLLGTVCLDQGDAEVDNTQVAINDDDLINTIITVRMRLALSCCGWCCRDALVEGKGEREGAGRGACTCATRVHVVTSVGIQRQRETNSMDGNHTGVLPGAYVLRVLGHRSGATRRWKASKPCRRRWMRARRGAAHLSSGDDAIQPSINLQIELLVKR